MSFFDESGTRRRQTHKSSDKNNSYDDNFNGSAHAEIDQSGAPPQQPSYGSAEFRPVNTNDHEVHQSLHQSHTSNYSMPMQHNDGTTPPPSSMMYTPAPTMGQQQQQQQQLPPTSSLQQPQPYQRTGYQQNSSSSAMMMGGGGNVGGNNSSGFPSFTSSIGGVMPGRTTRHDMEKLRKKGIMGKVGHWMKVILCCNGRPILATGIFCCLICIALVVGMVMLISPHIHRAPEIWDESVKFLQENQPDYFGKPKNIHPRDFDVNDPTHSLDNDPAIHKRPPPPRDIEPPLKPGELVDRVKEEADRMSNEYHQRKRQREAEAEEERRMRDAEFHGFKGAHGKPHGHHHHTHDIMDKDEFHPDQEDFGQFKEDGTEDRKEDQKKSSDQADEALRREIREIHQKLMEQSRGQEEEEGKQQKDLVDNYSAMMGTDDEKEKQSKLQRLKDRKGAQQRMLIKQVKHHLRELVHTVTEHGLINLAVVENRNKALLYWLQAIEKGHIQQPISNTLIHISAHHNLNVPRSLHMDQDSDWIADAFKDITPENYILPMAYFGIVSKIVWVKPPWVAEEEHIPNGVHKFKIGNVDNTQGVGIDSNGVTPFLSVRTPASRLTNVKTVELEVISLHDWVSAGRTLSRPQQKRRHERLVGIGTTNDFKQPPLLNIDLSAVLDNEHVGSPDFSESDISRMGSVLGTLLKYIYHLPSLQKSFVRKTKVSRPGLVVVSRSLKYNQVPFEWWPDAEETVYTALVNTFMESKPGRKKIHDIEELLHLDQDTEEMSEEEANEEVEEEEMEEQPKRKVKRRQQKKPKKRNTRQQTKTANKREKINEESELEQLKGHAFFKHQS